jgi:alpha-ribazole phosphatase
MGYSDIELSATGYRQVARLRDRLADDGIDAVYTSDLRRALVTAEVVSSGRKVDIVVCPELREINYGKVEGLTFEEIERLYPEVAESISNFSLQMKFPGGEDFEELVERVNKFLDELENHASSQSILIVSHSGPVRILICRLLGIDLGHWRQIRIENASLSIVETHLRGVIVSLLNDTAHLRGV